jgi:Leucine-rich repeat (LRR) protein
MSLETPNNPEESSLIKWPSTGLMCIPDGGSPALAEMVSRSLVNIQTSKALEILHRIGEHELCGPDYQLVCAWADELSLPPEIVLERLLEIPDEVIKDYENDYELASFVSAAEAINWLNSTRTILENGKFKRIFIASYSQLPILSIPEIRDLSIESLCLEQYEDNFNEISLAPFPNLKKLALHSCGIKYLDLSFVPNLIDLDVSCPYADFNLEFVVRLEKLDCSDLQKNELKLSSLEFLTELTCTNCFYLKNLDLSGNPNLRKIHCGGISIHSLDLSRQYKLEELRCAFGSICDLILPKQNNLLILDIHSNKVTDFNLKACPNLTELSINYNQIKELKLLYTPKLRKLSCFNGDIPFIDFSGAPNLTDICLPDGMLESLDLAKVPDLRKLTCWGNQITFLDLSVTPNLEELYISRNKIKKIDIRSLFKLRILRCDADVTIIQRPDQNF